MKLFQIILVAFILSFNCEILKASSCKKSLQNFINLYSFPHYSGEIELSEIKRITTELFPKHRELTYLGGGQVGVVFRVKLESDKYKVLKFFKDEILYFQEKQSLAFLDSNFKKSKVNIVSSKGQDLYNVLILNYVKGVTLNDFIKSDIVSFEDKEKVIRIYNNFNNELHSYVKTKYPNIQEELNLNDELDFSISRSGFDSFDQFDRADMYEDGFSTFDDFYTIGGGLNLSDSLSLSQNKIDKHRLEFSKNEMVIYETALITIDKDIASKGSYLDDTVMIWPHLENIIVTEDLNLHLIDPY